MKMELGMINNLGVINYKDRMAYRETAVWDLETIESLLQKSEKYYLSAEFKNKNEKDFCLTLEIKQLSATELFFRKILCFFYRTTHSRIVSENLQKFGTKITAMNNQSTDLHSKLSN